MEVLLLTTLFSVAFAVFFLVLFLRDRQVRRFGGVDRDALMPLDESDPIRRSQTDRTPVSRGCGCGGHDHHEDGDRKKSCQGCPRHS